MEAGILNKRIDIQGITKTTDGMGGFTETYTTIASSVAAAIWPVSGKEQIQAGQNKMTITHRIRIRYRNNMKSAYRVKFGDRYFDIESIINPSERNELLEMLCKETS
jgi:SPP1 family predicted phage head-tail adaptor